MNKKYADELVALLRDCIFNSIKANEPCDDDSNCSWERYEKEAYEKLSKQLQNITIPGATWRHAE